jgi:hypothetical protein
MKKVIVKCQSCGRLIERTNYNAKAKCFDCKKKEKIENAKKWFRNKVKSFPQGVTRH